VRATPLLLCLAARLLAQSQPDAPDVPVPTDLSPRPVLSDDRIFGIIPNYQTVSDPNQDYVPLRMRDKWLLFVKETVDPYTFASAAAGAGFSQWGDVAPKYGDGFKPYMQRFGAAQADIASQNFFSDAVLASFFHEDPRYFRKGPASPPLHRIAYALSRAVITRRDAGPNTGKDVVNLSGILGIGLGIGLSNAYYPAGSQNGEEMASRLATSFAAAALGNLLPEFWPDVKARLARYAHPPKF
jgi:hypothetical protein